MKREKAEASEGAEARPACCGLCVGGGSGDVGVYRPPRERTGRAKPEAAGSGAGVGGPAGEVLCAKTGYVVQSDSCAVSYGADESGREYVCATTGAGFQLYLTKI